MDLMNDRVEEVVRAALALSEEERGEVVERILDSLQDEDLAIDPAEVDEIEREAEAVVAGEVGTLPWKDLHARLLSKLRG